MNILEVHVNVHFFHFVFSPNILLIYDKLFVCCKPLFGIIKAIVKTIYTRVPITHVNIV